MTIRSKGAVTVLRWGLAFVFFYAAVASLRDPGLWAQFLPGFITAVIPANIAITLFSGYEILLAGVLFWGKYLKWSSLLATLTLAGIVAADWDMMDIVFRDVGLALAGLALFELSTENEKQTV